MKYTSEQIRAAAVHAAEQTIRRVDEFPEGIITSGELLQMAGLVAPPEPLTKEEHELWQFQLMALRQAWRCEVHERIGRWPSTLRGTGFRLLKPEENVDYAEMTVLKKVVKSIQKGLFIVRGTRNEDLDDEEKRKKINAELRFASLSGAARQAERQALRERGFKEEESSERPLMPGPMLGIDNN